MWISLLSHEIKCSHIGKKCDKFSSVGPFFMNLPIYIWILLNLWKILIKLQDGRKLCNHLVMFSSLLLVTALNQWWIELAFTRINIKWQGTFLSLFIYFFFCKMFLIPCNRKKRQCLYRTKVTYTICRITYNYQYAPRSLRLIFCLRLWVSALNFLKKL